MRLVQAQGLRCRRAGQNLPRRDSRLVYQLKEYIGRVLREAPRFMARDALSIEHMGRKGWLVTAAITAVQVDGSRLTCGSET